MLYLFFQIFSQEFIMMYYYIRLDYTFLIRILIYYSESHLRIYNAVIVIILYYFLIQILIYYSELLSIIQNDLIFHYIIHSSYRY